MADLRGGLRLIIPLALISVIGCASTATTFTATEPFEHTDRLLRDGEPKLTLAIRDERFELTSPFIGGSSVRGIARPNTTNLGWRLFVTELELFGTWENGWTSATFEASGSFLVDGGGSFEVVEPVEYWSLTTGEIRYYDTYILDDDGIRSVSARVDRLEALAEWLRDNGGAPFYGAAEQAGAYGDALRDDLEARLTRTFATTAAANVPDWLGELYNSGSVARDLREAGSLLLAIYNLSYLNTAGFDTMRLEANNQWS